MKKSPRKHVTEIIKPRHSRSQELLTVASLVLLLCLTRVKGITNQPTDWHAFRQSDTASVTREYIKHGIDILRPKYHDLGNIASGKDNPEGYRMVEFPFLNALGALVVLSSNWDAVVVSRVISAGLSVVSGVLIYFLGKSWSNERVGKLAAIMFAVLPYSAFYSRAILPEPGLVCFSLLAIYFFEKWCKKSGFFNYLLAVLSFSLALLLKPFGLFLLPLFGTIALLRFGWKAILNPLVLGFFALSVVPMMMWRNWILQFPEGIPASDWLFNGNGIRLRPSWWRWLVYERLIKIILGWGLVPFFAVGAWIGLKQKNWLYLSWWFSASSYLIIIATGNVQHDYYQYFLLPIICLTLGLGLDFCLATISQLKSLRKDIVLVLTVICLVVAFKYTDTYVAGFYGTRHDWESAGVAADKVLPQNAKVIANANSDTAFLYQTNRTGWPIGFEIDKKIALGAEYYLTTAFDDEAKQLEKKYKTVLKTDSYLLLDLQLKVDGVENEVRY